MQIEDYLYQKKLHEPLVEAKPTGMWAEDWPLLDRQALGTVRLSLAKNVAYNIVNEKTTYDLFKALSNMCEKPSASNTVFLIRQLVNTKMKEGAPVADHVNEFNLILSRLMSVDIKFDDEVQALLLLSLLPENWSGTVTTVSGSTGSTKLMFDNIRDLILGKISKGHFQNQCSKHVTSRDVEVNMAARDYDDTLLERFKLRFCKVHLADDKTLDITGIGNVVLKTSFGTSWTLKDVRYILGLKKRLISVGLLDEEGYHVGFGNQHWKVTKGSLVVAHGNKRGSLYMVEVPSDGINAVIDGRGNTALWHQRLGHMSEKGMKILASKGRILDLQKAVVGFFEPCVLGKQKKVSFVKSRNTRKLQRLELVHTDVYGPTSVASIGGSHYYVTFIDDNSRKNGVAKRMNRTLNERAKSMRLHVGLPKMFWEDSVTTAAYLINGGPTLRTFRVPNSRRGMDSKSHKVIRSRDVTFNEDSLYGAKAVTDSKITQSPVRSSDASEGSKNSGSFEDSGRSNEEDSKDKASSKKGGSETLCQPLGDHFKLSKKQAPKTEASRQRMTKVPYALAVGSVMKGDSIGEDCTIVSPGLDVVALLIGVMMYPEVGLQYWNSGNIDLCWVTDYEGYLRISGKCSYGGYSVFAFSTGGTVSLVGCLEFRSVSSNSVQIRAVEAEYMDIADDGKELLQHGLCEITDGMVGWSRAVGDCYFQFLDVMIRSVLRMLVESLKVQLALCLWFSAACVPEVISLSMWEIVEVAKEA
ncbi:retrovirus-related pol polyprotein from transposon TNT 1-94 [Tanacetum coccineum]